MIPSFMYRVGHFTIEKLTYQCVNELKHIVGFSLLLFLGIYQTTQHLK